MESKNKHKLIWVHPDFKEKIKIEAAKQRISILKYTERVAKESKELMLNGKKKYEYRI